MALTLDLTYSSESVSGDVYEGVFTDATANYSSGGNPARADGALYITGEKINYDSSIAGDVTFTDYDESADTTFTFQIDSDGWFQFKYIFIPEYAGGTAYVEFDAVYYSGAVYRAIDSTTGNLPTDTDFWEPISSPTDLVDNDGEANESANCAVLLENIIIFPFAKTKFGDKAEVYALNTDGSFKDAEQFTAYKELGAIVTALQGCNTRSRWASGERIARYASTLS
jgi:hypothetical protein